MSGLIMKDVIPLAQTEMNNFPVILFTVLDKVLISSALLFKLLCLSNTFLVFFLFCDLDAGRMMFSSSSSVSDSWLPLDLAGNTVLVTFRKYPSMITSTCPGHVYEVANV